MNIIIANIKKSGKIKGKFVENGYFNTSINNELYNIVIV